MSNEQNAHSNDHISDEPIAVTSDGVAQTTPGGDSPASAGEHRVVNDDDAGTYTDIDLESDDDTTTGTA
jgi:hypothetical protein